jgi:hypothetical protein
VHFDDIPARDDIARREWLEHHTGRRSQIQGVPLDEVAGLGDRVIAGLAQRPRTSRRAASPFHPKKHRGAPRSALAERTQNAADHRNGDPPTRVPEQHRQLVLAPTRGRLSEPTHSLRLLRRPGGTTPRVRPRRAAFQRPQVLPVVAPLPAF